MKISKSLLTVIAVAVTVGTLSSCTKDNTQPTENKLLKRTLEKNVNYNDCPACGMG